MCHNTHIKMFQIGEHCFSVAMPVVLEAYHWPNVTAPRAVTCNEEKLNLEVFRIAWKDSMSSYRQALKVARTKHIRKLIDNNQNNPRFLFSTVLDYQINRSPDLNIPSQFNSNDFMNFFTDKIDNIRNTITNVDYTASSTWASFIAPNEKLHCFTTIGQDELNKLNLVKLHLLHLQMTCFLHQTKAASHC